jgi:hypothetical protein
MLDLSPRRDTVGEFPACIAVQSNDGLKRLRCCVPARSKVSDDRTVDRKEFRDLLLVRASCIPSPHGHILFIQRASSGEFTDEKPTFEDLLTGRAQRGEVRLSEGVSAGVEL